MKVNVDMHINNKNNYFSYLYYNSCVRIYLAAIIAIYRRYEQYYRMSLVSLQNVFALIDEKGQRQSSAP